MGKPRSVGWHSKTCTMRHNQVVDSRAGAFQSITTESRARLSSFPPGLSAKNVIHQTVEVIFGKQKKVRGRFFWSHGFWRKGSDSHKDKIVSHGKQQVSAWQSKGQEISWVLRASSSLGIKRGALSYKPSRGAKKCSTSTWLAEGDNQSSSIERVASVII